MITAVKRNIRDSFLEVADRFEKHPETWGQGFYGSPEGKACLVGALIGERYYCTTAVEYLGMAYGPDECGYVCCPETWNDKQGRTVEEVIAVLRKAAKIVEKELTDATV